MKREATYLSIASIVAAFLLALVATTPARAWAPIIVNQTMTIAENSPNGSTTTPSQIDAFDPESQPLTYDLISGDGAAAFQVNSVTGVITVKDSTLLDYEVKDTFTLNVRVTDTEPDSDDAVITIELIDVADQPPVMNNQNFTVGENSPAGTTVGTLVYSDGDSNDSHTFDITGGSGDGVFNIDSLGKITVAPGAQLNFEATPSYNMTVEIEDEGGLTDTALITVALIDANENPVVNPATFDLSEAAGNGAVVGTVTANDPDGDPLLFSIIGSSPFAINSGSGQITVANSSQLDYEIDPSIDITVQAQDDGGKTGSATITVDLIEQNDKPKATPIPTVIVNEGDGPRVINLWQYFSDDEDSDAELTFLMQNNDNPSLVTSAVVNNTNGTLTLTFAAGAGGGTANVTVRAFDTGGEYVDNVVKVDVNDAPTGPATQNVTVNEDAATSLVDLYDVFDDSENTDAELTYNVISVSNPALFDPDPTITKPNLTLDYAPDANGKSDVKVRATDGGGLWVETTFKVTVNALNDPPTTTGINNVSVDEDAPNTVINLAPVFADKEDADTELDYSVTFNSTPDNLFESVQADDDAMTLTIDYRNNVSGSATVTVQAKDTDNASVSATFQVTVGAANDAPTVSDIDLEVKEDEALNFNHGHFNSHYADADNDPLVKVRIESLPSDGTLRLAGNPVASGQEIAAGALGDLVFMPATNWNQGDTSFEWNGSDGQSYAANPALVTITVQSQNDKPTLDPIDKTGDEGTNILFQATDFINAFHDVDGDSLVRIQITQLPTNGWLRRNNSDVQLNEQINVSDLGQLRFVPQADWSGSDSFRWKGYDGEIYSDPATVTLTVNAKNDAPNLDLNGANPGTGFNATFVAGGQSVAIAGDVTITDIDNTMMQSAKVIIVNLKNGTKEVLSANTTGTNIDVSYSAANGTLFLSGSDTIANYEKVLGTVRYRIEPDVANPDSTVRNIQFNVYDGTDNSNDAVANVDVIKPRIEVTITPPLQTVIKGTTAIFTIVVQNTGDVALNNIQVASATVPDCNRTFNTLAAGASLPAYACIATNVTQRIDNKVVATALDAEMGTQVTADDEAIVRVLRDIVVDIAPDPTVGDTVIRGQNAVFNVTVANPSEGRLKDVEVKAFVDYDLLQANAEGEQPAENVPAPACDQTIGDLNGGQEKVYTCTIANVQASFAIEVIATGMIEGIGETQDFDIAEIGVIDITLEVFADPFQVLAGQPTEVEFSMTMTNVSNVPVAIQTLTSAAHGNLLNAGNGQVTANTCPGMNLAVPAGEVRSCSYEVVLILQPPAFTNVITLVAADDEGHELTTVDEAIVSVADFTPLQVVLSANPTSLVAPGGEVNLTVQVTNNMSTDLTLDALNDSGLGSVDGLGTCELPRTIVGNGIYTCTYPVTITGKRPGDVVTHTITAIADAEEDSDSVAINITGQPSVRMMLPSISNRPVPGEPNNGPCEALPILTNLLYYYLPDDANDWYRFTLESPGRIRVVLNDYMAEGQLLLYSGNCASPTYLQHNGEQGVRPNRIVDLGSRPAGTYFIWIIADNRLSGTAMYNLRIETQAP